jgi:drug/metabolite transporter (DMT)-like permease
MGILGKLAYDEGATVGTLLVVRFTVAAALFWALLAVVRAPRPRLSRRDLGLAVGLGAVGYAAQAGAYFAALSRIDASLVSLLVYTFPAMVAVAAIAIGRERANARRGAALVLALGGVGLVVAGAGTGALDPLGVALALAGALIYSAYILVSDGIAGRLDPRVLAAIVCTGAAVTLALATAALGDLRPGDLTAEGWLWLVLLAAIPTFVAIGLFFAGLRLVGPTSAAILSTMEPVATVGLAFLVFGDVLGPFQLLGGALVLASVPALHLRRRRRLPMFDDDRYARAHA